jgi:hypothetical protein
VSTVCTTLQLILTEDMNEIWIGAMDIVLDRAHMGGGLFGFSGSLELSRIFAFQNNIQVDRVISLC